MARSQQPEVIRDEVLRLGEERCKLLDTTVAPPQLLEQPPTNTSAKELHQNLSPRSPRYVIPQA